MLGSRTAREHFSWAPKSVSGPFWLFALHVCGTPFAKAALHLLFVLRRLPISFLHFARMQNWPHVQKNTEPC